VIVIFFFFLFFFCSGRGRFAWCPGDLVRGKAPDTLAIIFFFFFFWCSEQFDEFLFSGFAKGLLFDGSCCNFHEFWSLFRSLLLIWSAKRCLILFFLFALR
jgi:hypothetical protein